MAAAYYNEIDSFCADWLEALIADGMIPDGDVDRRDIWDVAPTDLVGYTQCHFFAGIGGWPIALRLAGWPDDRPVWTGSCPCQAFSQAGKRKGFADERHLWPVWFWLIEQCRPQVVFGEQVASKEGLAWLDLISTDLAGAGYTVEAADLCAAGVGAPHIRQRLWFCGVANAGRRNGVWRDVQRPGQSTGAGGKRARNPPEGPGSAGGVANRQAPGWEDIARWQGSPWKARGSEPDSPVRRVEFVNGYGCEARGETATPVGQRDTIIATGWDGVEWIECADGKFRPIEPGIYPLAYGLPGPSPAIGPYGNAIVPQVARVFIEAIIDVLGTL